MIFVDTGIIIDFWKNPTDRIRKVFLKHKVAICGIVKSELIHGAKSKKDINIISKSLSGLEYVPIEEFVWEDVGNFLYRLRKKGITVPFQDAVICPLALKNNLLYACLSHQVTFCFALWTQL